MHFFNDVLLHGASVFFRADSLAGRSTVGSHDRSSATSPSYSNLENLMRNTVDMSRAAVISSPHRSLGPDQQPGPGLSSMDSLSKQLRYSFVINLMLCVITLI